jgi:hypothetical protein
MSRRSDRRGQLILLAAAVVVTALVPMILAYAQVGYGGAPTEPAPAQTGATVADSKRVLERSVAEAAGVVSARTGPNQHQSAADIAVAELEPAVQSIESTGTDRTVVDVSRNASAAGRWAERACPRGPNRAFGPCVLADGVVTQTRANTTALVAVAVDVHARGPHGATRTTLVVRGVRGAVADRHTGATPATSRQLSYEARALE